jgi:hypothetical protein
MAPIILFFIIGAGIVLICLIIERHKKFAQFSGVLGWLGFLLILSLTLVSQW